MARRGTYIIRKGEIAKDMFFLYIGKVELIGNNMKSLCSFGAGSFFGEVALFCKTCIRTCNIRAMVDSEMYSLSKNDFDQITMQYPNFSAKLKKVALKRSRPKKTLQAIPCKSKLPPLVLPPIFNSCSFNSLY